MIQLAGSINVSSFENCKGSIGSRAINLNLSNNFVMSDYEMEVWRFAFSICNGLVSLSFNWLTWFVLDVFYFQRFSASTPFINSL